MQGEYFCNTDVERFPVFGWARWSGIGGAREGEIVGQFAERWGEAEERAGEIAEGAGAVQPGWKWLWQWWCCGMLHFFIPGYRTLFFLTFSFARWGVFIDVFAQETVMLSAPTSPSGRQVSIIALVDCFACFFVVCSGGNFFEGHENSNSICCIFFKCAEKSKCRLKLKEKKLE